VRGHVKRRARPVPGSIPAVLDTFGAEVRFYREIAPVAGVRVPACYEASQASEGTILVLEDLSAWRQGADPAVAAGVLAALHHRWEGKAALRWPWLRRPGAAADLVEDLFGGIGRAGRATLIHGDASLANMRTGPGGEVALLDWEDVAAAPGILDVAWLLVSSVDPPRWDEVIAAYRPSADLASVLPAVTVQGLLSLSDTPAGSTQATAWMGRLEEAAARLAAAS